MRSPLEWTTAALLLAGLLATSIEPAAAEDLQWQHRSARTTTTSRSATVRPTKTALPEKQLVAKRPTLPATVQQAPEPMAPVPDARPLNADAAASTQATATALPSAAELAAAQATRRRAQSRAIQSGVIQAAATTAEIIPHPAGKPAAMTGKSPTPIGPDMAEHWDGGIIEGPTFASSACQCGEPSCECYEPSCGVDYYGEPTCGCGGDGCSHCAFPSIWGSCIDRGAVPIHIYLPPIRELTFFAGVQGFKGPLDRNRDSGNFGFHEGFNFSGPMAWFPWYGLGYQVGYQATHSQLHGDANAGTSDPHTQQFLTAGLFRRKCVGLQYGVVYDLMRDERQGAVDFGQIRGEISLRNPCNREIGFAWTANTNSEDLGTPAVTFAAVDQYKLFYRAGGPRGGEVRCFAGLTDNSSGLLGTDFIVPLNPRWSLQGNWTYLIPEHGDDGLGSQEEAWNVGMQLVWHYGCRAQCWHKRPYRPLFDVANNGSMIVVD